MNRIFAALVIPILFSTGCGVLPHERYLPNMTYVSNYRLGGTVIIVENAIPGVGMDIFQDGRLVCQGLTIQSPPFRLDTYDPFPNGGGLETSFIVKVYDLDGKNTYRGVAERTFHVGDGRNRSTETWIIREGDIGRGGRW